MKIHKKTVLITGAGGFIGANLTRKLVQLGFTPHLILKNTTNTWRLQDIAAEKVIFHHINLLNQKRLSQIALKINPSIIVHFASYGAYPYQNDINQMIEVNIKGTLNLLSATQNIPYDIFINTGTSSEYGFKLKPMKEVDVLEPTSFYAGTKASATLLCLVFSQSYKKPIVVVRPFSVYGPYEEGTRFVPTIIKALLENKPIQVTEGIQKRDFIYIDDVTNAYVQIMSTKKPVGGKIFNIGTGKQYSNDEVIQNLFKVTNKKVPVIKGGFSKRRWDTPHWVADIAYTKRTFLWKPSFSLEKGLKSTYQWLLSHNQLYDEKN